MEKHYRLKRNGQFHYVYRKGKRVGGHEMTLFFVRGPRVLAGFSVSKKVGNAVTRNRVKRRLREAFRPLIPYCTSGMYVFSARDTAGDASYRSLDRTMRYLMNKAGLLKGLPQ